MSRYARITVAVPSHELMPATFGYDLASLCAHSVAAMPDGVSFGINMVTGTYIVQARQQLIDACLQQGATHILWLDSDMRFPKTALVDLLQHKVPIVGVNYAKRAFGGGFTALKRVGVDGPGEVLQTTLESTGLEEVEALGFGVVLMRADALVNLPDPVDEPWFDQKYMGNGEWMGEDVYFCEMLRKAGNRIFVDHDLSKLVGHVGQHEFTIGAALPPEVG